MRDKAFGPVLRTDPRSSEMKMLRTFISSSLRACSLVVERSVCIRDMGVRFSPGPHHPPDVVLAHLDTKKLILSAFLYVTDLASGAGFGKGAKDNRTLAASRVHGRYSDLQQFFKMSPRNLYRLEKTSFHPWNNQEMRLYRWNPIRLRLLYIIGRNHF